MPARNSLLMFSSFALIAGTSGWQSAPYNGANTKVFYSTETKPFDYKHNQRQIYWHLRNDYDKTIKVQYEVSHETSDGKVVTNTYPVTLPPGKTTDSGGDFTIADPAKGLTIRIVSIEVVGTPTGNPHVIEFPGPQKKK